MKSFIYILTVAATAALLVTVGCKKSESGAEADLQKVTQPAQPPSVATPVTEAAKEATAQVAATAAQASSKAQELIEKAKGLVDAKKYTDASSILQQLASLKLTPDQQKLVDALKAQIQQAATKEATAEGTKAVGNLLGGKK